MKPSPSSMGGNFVAVKYMDALRRLLRINCAAFAANFAVVAAIEHYDLHLGPVDFVAHGCAKPLLLMNGAFLLACFVGPACRGPVSGSAREQSWALSKLDWMFAALVVVIGLGVHWRGFMINFADHDWNHSHISGSIHSLGDALHLFSRPQADGFYRPLTFLSLWIDYTVFHDANIAYHVHNFAIHCLNAVLVGRLGRALGFNSVVARWSSVLFVCSPASFEPVLWPAARFDLLATMFSLLAVILSVAYLSKGGKVVIGAAACFIAALLNKESAYAVPAIVAVLTLSRKHWGLPVDSGARVKRLFTILLCIALAVTAVRVLIYGNLGGYSVATGQASPHFTVGAKSFTTLLSRLLPLSVMVFNTTYLDTGPIRAVLLFFSALLVATAFSVRVRTRERLLLLLLLVTGIPVLNLVGWIGPTGQHSRYLYLPACWFCLLLPAVLYSVRPGSLLLVGWVASYISVLAVDQHVYKTFIGRIPLAVAAIAHDATSIQQPIVIDLVNVPPEPLGIFFFRSELIVRIEESLPNLDVRTSSPDGRGGQDRYVLRYNWSARERELLVRIP